MIKAQYIILALTLLLAGCSSKQPDRYYNSKDDFSIKFPKGWENKEGFMRTDIISLSPKTNAKDQFRENVNVVVEQLPDGMNLSKYFDANLPKLSNVIQNFQEIDAGTAIINDNEAEWLIYTGNIGTSNLKSKQYYMVYNGKGYVITCTATPETYNNYKNIFDETVQSFQFE